MNHKIIILSYFLLGLSFLSFAQQDKTDTRSANRRFADSMYAVNSGRVLEANLDEKVLSKKNIVSPDTIMNRSLTCSKVFEQENQEKEIVVEFKDAPCKTLYNNTWCTNKVKMPSFRFGEFPDEFKIRLIDPKKDQGFHFPCKSGRKSSQYGWRWGRPHGGVDFAIDIGEPIYAVFDGVIRVAQVNGGYGKMILIRHYNNLETLYGHLDKINVKVGQSVKAGDVIGYSGNTGFSTGPHLHFECRCLYQTFDPEWILDIDNRTLKTDRINIEKTFFGIERAEKQIKKRQPITSLSKVNRTFEGKPYYSFKEKYAPKAEVRYLAKGGNQPVKKLIEINHEDKSTWRYWRVRKGDTITKLAERFNVTPRQIIEMNNLKDEALKPNSRIRVR